MDDNQTVSELVKAMHQIQAELQQMNKTLSAIAGQGKAAAGASTARPPASRPTGYAGQRSARPTSFKRTEGGTEASDSSGEQGFRFPKKKSPGRPKAGGKLPPKKGGGYPKKAR